MTSRVSGNPTKEHQGPRQHPDDTSPSTLWLSPRGQTPAPGPSEPAAGPAAFTHPELSPPAASQDHTTLHNSSFQIHPVRTHVRVTGSAFPPITGSARLLSRSPASRGRPSPPLAMRYLLCPPPALEQGLSAPSQLALLRGERTPNNDHRSPVTSTGPGPPTLLKKILQIIG